MQLGENMAWVWLGVIVLAVVVESMTVQIVSIWFAVGALGALILSFFPIPTGWQVAVFLLLTAASLLTIRPLLMKSINSKKQRTNADRVVGMTAIVEEKIVNWEAKGQVRVEHALWSARTVDNSVAEVGDAVQVQAIEGVKLMVLPLKKTSGENEKV